MTVLNNLTFYQDVSIKDVQNVQLNKQGTANLALQIT